jgi:hypothetical protein
MRITWLSLLFRSQKDQQPEPRKFKALCIVFPLSHARGAGGSERSDNDRDANAGPVGHQGGSGRVEVAILPTAQPMMRTGQQGIDIQEQEGQTANQHRGGFKKPCLNEALFRAVDSKSQLHHWGYGALISGIRGAVASYC